MTKLSRIPTLLAALMLFPLVAACDSGDDGGHTHEESPFMISATIAPDPPTTAQSTMVVTVTDMDGAAVVGATVVVDPQMPMMGHGSNETPVVTDNGDGTYTATPVTLFMPGEWVVTIHVNHDVGGESHHGMQEFTYQVAEQ